jgi:hypothetical protein
MDEISELRHWITYFGGPEEWQSRNTTSSDMPETLESAKARISKALYDHADYILFTMVESDAKTQARQAICNAREWLNPLLQPLTFDDDQTMRVEVPIAVQTVRQYLNELAEQGNGFADPSSDDDHPVLSAVKPAGSFRTGRNVDDEADR